MKGLSDGKQEGSGGVGKLNCSERRKKHINPLETRSIEP